MIALMLGVILVSTNAQSLTPKTVWECNLGSPLCGAPVLFPCVEKPTGVVTWTEAGCVVLLDGNGSILWQADLGEKGEASPAVGDINGDGSVEVVSATLSGKLFALDSQGRELWRYDLGAAVRDWESPTLGDVDGDGIPEILIGNMDGWLICVSGTGHLIWRFKADEQKASSAAFVPSSVCDGGAIVLGTENDQIVAVTLDGRLKWSSRHEGQYGRTNPAVGDLNGDGRYEVIVHTSYNNPRSRILALDLESGSLLWEAPLNLHGYASNAIADVDGDGINEAVVALRSNTIYCFEGNGKERWHTITGGHAFFFAPAIADIDGDGRCEILAGVRDTNERGNSWFVLNDMGEILGEYPIHGGSPATPLVGDINADGILDIILPGTKAGLLRCVTFGGPHKGVRLPWVSPRYDAARTGFVPNATAKSRVSRDTLSAKTESELTIEWLDTPTWGKNEFRITNVPRTSEEVCLQVCANDPLGRQTTRVWRLSSGELPEVVPVQLIGAGHHKVTVALYDGGGQGACLGKAEHHVRLPAFRAMGNHVREQLKIVEQVAGNLPSESSAMARLLMERKAQRESALRVLEQSVAKTNLTYMPDVDKLAKEVERFRSELVFDTRLANRIARFAQENPQHVLAVWRDPNPWDEVSAMLDGEDLFTKEIIPVTLYKSEYESVAVNVLNVTAEPITAQLRVGEKNRSALLFYEVIDTPRSDGSWVPDALAELNSANSIIIPPGTVRTLWITVNGKALPSGITELLCEILPLGWDTFRAKVVLRAEVSSLDLANAPLFRVCNWSSPSYLARMGLDPERIVVAREHGMNVFTTALPHRECDAAGNLVGSPDWQGLDAELALMGDDGFVLLSGWAVKVPEGVEEFGEVHIKAERARLIELVDHLNALGWGKERWALYPVDEPGLFGGTRIRLFERIASHFKKAMPDVPVYANPSGFVTPENMAGMVSLTDVWQPEQALLRRQPELAVFFLKTGKPVWCYEAPGDVKRLKPLGYYRANPWMAFRLGLNGTGFWIQFYTGEKEIDNDLWLTRTINEWGANYVNAGKEVISRRWEAFRDGIEDVRAFLLLRGAVEKARAAGRHHDLVAEAEQLLTERIAKATQKAWECGDITRFLRDYEMDFDEICRIRKRVAELTLALETN